MTADRLCPDCGYDLRGLSGDRCPECGLVLSDSDNLAVTLPWAHRRSIGRVRAYGRTVLLAAVRPKRLAANLARPVSWADAVAFRRVTAALAGGPTAVLLTVLVCLPGGLLAPALRDPRQWWPELLVIPVGWAGLWLAFLTTAGVASYWFHPRSVPVVQQNRAVALSLYGCGPLAMVPVVCGCVAAAAVAASPAGDQHLWDAVGTAFGCGAFGVGLLAAACWWWSTLALLRHTTHCGVVRQASLGLGLLIAWPLLAGLFAVGLPLVYLWLVLVARGVHPAG